MLPLPARTLRRLTRGVTLRARRWASEPVVVPPADQALTLVADVCAAAGVPAPPVTVADEGRLAYVKGGTLTVDVHLLERYSREHAAAVIAHELGHLHADQRANRMPPSAWLLPAAAAALFWFDPPAALSATVTLATGVVVLAHDRARSRADEFAADRWAADRGFTAALAGALARDLRPARTRAFDRHPCPAGRLAALGTPTPGRGHLPARRIAA